jgi:hypothetical protein
MTVDPGRTTGVAAGYVELKPTLKETLAEMTRHRAVEVTGPWMSQGRELAVLYGRFRFRANVEAVIPLGNIHLVVEDFVLRMPAATTDLTSIWVAACMCGYLPEDVVPGWQMPSKAKTLATNERLRMWGLWEVGSEHKRDANRHLAAFVDGLVTRFR